CSTPARARTRATGARTRATATSTRCTATTAAAADRGARAGPAQAAANDPTSAEAATDPQANGQAALKGSATSAWGDAEVGCADAGLPLLLVIGPDPRWSRSA